MNSHVLSINVRRSRGGSRLFVRVGGRSVHVCLPDHRFIQFALTGFSWRGILVGRAFCYQRDAVPKHAPTKLLHESGGQLPDPYADTGHVYTTNISSCERTFLASLPPKQFSNGQATTHCQANC